MSSHIHLIVANDDDCLSDILRDFKSYTAKRILKMIAESLTESRKEWLLYLFEYFAKSSVQNKDYQFWQKTNHPTELFTAPVFEQKMEYIHQNPVKAMLVNDASAYVYSSANPDSPFKIHF